MTYDAELNLIVCEHATSSLVRDRPDGRREIAGLAFRGAGAEFAERRLRQVRRRDLFLRSVVRPDAALRRRAAAPARLAGRLSRAARRRRAAAAGRPLPVRSAERPVLLAGRDSGSTSTTPSRHLIRVFDVDADGALGNGRVFASGIVSASRARRAGRHEMRRAGQCLGVGAGRHLGLCAGRQADRQGARSRTGQQPELGRAGLAHALRLRHAFGLCGAGQGRAAQRAFHARRPARAGRGAAGAALGGDCQPVRRQARRAGLRGRSRALRADHPGHAERRGDGRRRLRLLRLAGALPRAERHRQRRKRLAEAARPAACR